MATWYCDMDIGTDTGTGTIGDPYGTISFALSSITRSTNPTTDYLHVRGSSTRVTSLTFPTGGNNGQMLIISGYNATAFDLIEWRPTNPTAITLPHINLTAANLQSGNADGIVLHNMRITTTGTAAMDNNYTGVYGCWITARSHINRTHCFRSRFVMSSAAVGLQSSRVSNCLIFSSGVGLYVNGSFGRVAFNRIVATGVGIELLNSNLPTGSEVFHNSIYCGSSGILFSRGQLEYAFGNVIHRTASGAAFQVINDAGYAPTYGFEGNRLFQCSSVVSAANTPIYLSDNTSLSSAPYTDPANDNWTLSNELAAIRNQYNLVPGAVQPVVSGGVSGFTGLSGVGRLGT